MSNRLKKYLAAFLLLIVIAAYFQLPGTSAFIVIMGGLCIWDEHDENKKNKAKEEKK